eukprot:8423486-Pyramimonas_sp.AAC.1
MHLAGEGGGMGAPCSTPSSAPACARPSVIRTGTIVVSHTLEDASTPVDSAPLERSSKASRISWRA